VAVRDLKTIPKTDEFFRDESSWPCKHSAEKLEMIKKARKSGMSVKAIADMFEISQSYVSNIMNGRERSAEG
jgi:predicted XRE-type DNA-binding protein